MAIATEDHALLRAPPDLFDLGKLEAKHTGWGRFLLRNVLPLEILAQLLHRQVRIRFRGGTLLQSRLQWPPRRASIDLDLETSDSADLKENLQQVVHDFSKSNLTMETVPTTLPGFKADITFPLVPPAGWTMRVDALEVTRQNRFVESWSLPTPWNGCPSVIVPSLETQAAQKLLLLGPPPFGRHLEGAEGNRGRKSLIKDLYDLDCLASQTLVSGNIREAVADELARKSSILKTEYSLDQVRETGTRTLALFAGPRPPQEHPSSSLWRAYSGIRPTIRDGFTEINLRIAAGCAHYALNQLSDGSFDWSDSWLPRTQQTRRRAWIGGRAIETVVTPAADFEAISGLAEAWALPQPTLAR